MRNEEQKLEGAHRISYKLFKGQIPINKEILHQCNNKSCVNPEHLIIGTHIKNMKDAWSEGLIRAAFGENHGKSKLTEKQVLSIRSDTRSPKELARVYNVDRSTIYSIISRKTWNYLR